MTTEFLTQPNLPIKKVSLICISKTEQDIIDSLQSLGVKCLTIEPCTNLQKPVMAHADMNILHLGKDVFAANNLNVNAIEKITKIRGNMRFISQLKSQYPKDVKLNIAIIGNRVICNQNYAATKVIDYLVGSGKNIIHVNQGYTKCSIAVVNNSSIMTSDRAIYESCTEYGFNCLLLEPGDITLEGYNYGFIGGCCGLIDKNVIAFTGDLNKYSEGNKVKNFLKNNNCDYVCLTNKKLIDVGGILPIKQFI